MFNFVVLCPNRLFQFNSRIVSTHFSSIMTLNNWKMIAETWSYIFRWRYRLRRCRASLSSLFCGCVDDVIIWWQMFSIVVIFQKCWFQFYSGIVRTRFASEMTLNNWEMIAEMRSYILRWRSRCRRRRLCLSFLISTDLGDPHHCWKWQ